MYQGCAAAAPHLRRFSIGNHQHVREDTKENKKDQNLPSNPKVRSAVYCNRYNTYLDMCSDIFTGEFMTEQTWKIGDCLEIMQEYPDNYFDLILTDPPYGIGEANGKNHSRGGKTKFGGKMHAGRPVDSRKYGFNSWDNERLDQKYFDEMLRISKNQIIFGGNYYIDYLKPTSCFIVWDKNNGDNDFADCELAWTSFDTAVRLFKYRWNGMLQGDMKNKELRVHPTQKPVPVFEWILNKYANVGDKILDPFCGSGTTLEACMNLNLECLAIDKSDEWVPHYKKRLKSDNSKLSDWPVTL